MIGDTTMSHEITLYQFEECPFCAKVRNKLEDLGWEYEKVNVSRDREDETRTKIAQESGVTTVPVAHINGQWIGDSGAIIEHLDKLNS